MRIYIAGPMTGKKDHNFPAFEAAAKRLRDDGHFVINPAELSVMFGKPETVAASFKAYYAGAAQSAPDGWSVIAQSVIDADLAAIRSCHAIYLLRGWEQSQGAKKELAEAIAHRLTIMLEEALSLPRKETAAPSSAPHAAPRATTPTQGSNT